MEISILQYVLINLPEFRKCLFTELGATDCSSLMLSCMLVMTKREKARFLLPIRDIPLITQISQTLSELGCVVTLLGFDLYKLIHRVRFPASSSVLGAADETLTLCLAIMNKNMNWNKHGKQDSVWSVLHSIASASDDVIVLGSNTIALVFRQSHPIRLVMEMPGNWLYKSLTAGFDESFDNWNECQSDFANSKRTVSFELNVGLVLGWELLNSIGWNSCTAAVTILNDTFDILIWPANIIVTRNETIIRQMRTTPGSSLTVTANNPSRGLVMFHESTTGRNSVQFDLLCDS